MNPEQIAYWFFRLNGCTTITNFIIHADKGGAQRTEVDVLAVRFPNRVELLTSDNPMRDHDVFNSDGRIDIIIAEVKHGFCQLSGPWTNPEDENMQRVLYAIGAFEKNQIPVVTDALYHEGIYRDDTYQVRLFAVGDFLNPKLLPAAEQLLWNQMLAFIFDRFTRYQFQKAQHEQWDTTGKWLHELAANSSMDEFITVVREKMYRYVGGNHD